MVSVVVGHDGWLFLGDDTNASIRQFKGQLTIGETERLKWVAYHHDVNSLASNVGCDHIFMIAPVSYTHLDVYKRQSSDLTPPA